VEPSILGYEISITLIIYKLIILLVVIIVILLVYCTFVLNMGDNLIKLKFDQRALMNHINLLLS